MMQDRAQKSQALRYVVGKHWFPQLEGNVLPTIATSRTPMQVTDVDLLAMIPDEFDGFRSLLIDCKTRKNESPISRALWQKGLMEQLKATRGICILKKDKVIPDHRYAASQLGVLLFTEEEFDEYANATQTRQNRKIGHIAEIDLWQKFFDIPLKYQTLASGIEFSRSGYWMCQTDSESCRKTIIQTMRLSHELDPAKHEHMVVVGDLIALFMLSLAKIVNKVFINYLKPSHQDELSNALLLLLYGGRDSYEHRNSLLKMVYKAIPQNQNIRENLSLPEWDMFIQLVRHCLDVPLEVSKAPLLIRELSWSLLSEKRQLDFAMTLASESPQAAKLSMLGAEYLCKAAKLPPEFRQDFSRTLLDIQTTPP